MREETFGPVIPIMRVRNDEEAIQAVNDSEFGLTASIWTKDTAKGEELAELVEAGTVFVNRCDFPSPVSFNDLGRDKGDRCANRSKRTSRGRVGRTPVKESR